MIVSVALGDRSYDIHIENGVLGAAASLVPALSASSSVTILTHPSVARLHLADLAGGLEDRGRPVHTVTVPSGERYKTLRTVARLYSRLIGLGVDRHGAIVTLGGGVIGDMGGFVAATYLRGISFVQAPTTLLAQVDASVGGKTGVDLPEGKNLVGAFCQPRAVLIDPSTLRTLPARELRSGLAEVIKHGIICDAAYLQWTCDHMRSLHSRRADALAFAVARSCEIKAAVVAEDETELGRRAILNFGHTVGHALEATTGFRRFKHGEAVAIGMCTAALISEEWGVGDTAVTQTVVQCARLAGLPTAFPRDVATADVLARMKSDKKAIAGAVRFVLAPRVGSAVVRSDVPSEVVARAIDRQRGWE